jgi:hypothetical protein
MRALARLIGLGFIALCLFSVLLKVFVPLLGLLGYAPIDLGIGPAGQPVEVVIWYGTKQKPWLEEAARRFEREGRTVGGRPVTLTLVGLGSREIADRVARQDWGSDPRPKVISPPSSIWVEVLRSDWAARNSGAEIIEGDASHLVLTPLAAIAWNERANVLWPQGVAAFWADLHDALANPQGWVGVAEANGFAPGSPEHQEAQGWGLVKFGHTSPLRSNSGRRR